jgi:phosphoglycolate phosphatase-like HAD superfamily hydrolase
VRDYCKKRYAGESEQMERLWLATMPVSTNMQSRWNKNALLTVLREFGEGLVKPERRSDWPAAKPDAHFAALGDVVETLKGLDWDKDEFLRRDMVDIARVWADRLAVESENRMVLAYLRWLDGDDSAKADVVREALRRAEVKDVTKAIMIGDRHHDINGGKANSLATIGVLYGFGSLEELNECGADFIAETPAQILEILNAQE